MALKRDFNMDYPWVAYGAFKELGELCSFLEKEKQTEWKQSTKVGEEFADVIIYLMQMIWTKYGMRLDLDMVVQQKIIKDTYEKKKTYKDGKITKR